MPTGRFTAFPAADTDAKLPRAAVAGGGGQAHGVVLLADVVELARELARISQGAQVRPVASDVAGEALDVPIRPMTATFAAPP